MTSKILTIIVFLILTTLPLSAMDRFEIITTEQLEQMLSERKAGKSNFVLMNALDEIIYRNVSIPGSVNAPWSNIDQAINQLGNDKNRLIITY